MTSLLGNFAFVDSITGDFIPADTAVLLDMSNMTTEESEDFGHSAVFRSEYAKKFGVDAEELEYHTVMEDHRNFHMNEDDTRNLLIFIHQHADSNSSIWEIADRLRAHLKTTVS